MLVDTHCHLSSKQFKEDVGQVIDRAREVGVRKMIVPAVNIRDARRIVELTEKYDDVYGLVGIYPGEIQKGEDVDVGMKEIRELLKRDKVLGIGEIGLDCYWDRKSIEEEKVVFEKQMELANEMGVPVVVHNRLAEDEIREVVEGLSKIPRGQFHCWSGSGEFLRYVLERGFYVSFGGNVTYKSRGELREMVGLVPEDRLLLETDSPYLPPEPLRGSRNEPKNVKITAEFLADLLGKSFDDLARQTTENTLRLFNRMK